VNWLRRLGTILTLPSIERASAAASNWEVSRGDLCETKVPPAVSYQGGEKRASSRGRPLDTSRLPLGQGVVKRRLAQRQGRVKVGRKAALSPRVRGIHRAPDAVKYSGEGKPGSRKAPVPTIVGLHWTCELPECADVESTTYGMFTERRKGRQGRKEKKRPSLCVLCAWA
jgi:hypothetical protein